MARKIKPPKPPKRLKPSLSDPDDDLAFDPVWLDDEDDEDDLLDGSFSNVVDSGDYLGEPLQPDFIDYSIFDEDILAICGAAAARRGLSLFLNAAVDKPSFDGRVIRAQVADGAAVSDVSFEFEEEEFHCTSPADRRDAKRACAHVAALLYAWLRRPESFAFANLGAALQLFAQRPQLFAGSSFPPAYLQSILERWEKAPPELRSRISQMTALSSPVEVAQLRTMLEEFDAHQADRDFADLLGRLTLEQLRALARRRHWVLRATAKAKAIAELIAQLRASPLPESFSPEEEQLLRIQNTLWGLAGLPRHHSLLAEWKTHAGGNLKRLELALEGLQNAGVLFACTSEGIGLHYHWSPFLRSDMLPLLQPNVALLSPGGGSQARGTPQVSRVVAAAPSRADGTYGADGPALLNLVDAVIGYAEREPLRMAPLPVEPRLAENPLVGQWPYDPEELKAVSQSRGRFTLMAGALTVPWQRFFTAETQEALAALAGGLQDYGVWTAMLLIHSGIIVPGENGEARVEPARAADWHSLSPDQQLQRLWTVWCAGASPLLEFRMGLEDKQFIVRREPFDQAFTPEVLAIEAGLARAFIARVLAMLSPQTWYDWSAFIACVKRLRSAFYYSYSTPQQWWLEHAPSARRYDANIPQQWDAAWLPVLQSMLTGPLCWFGALEPTAGPSSQRNSPSGFRVTPLGAWLFTGGRQGRVPEFATVAVADGPPFTWLDENTFRVRAAPEAMRALAALRGFTEPSRELLTFRLSLPAIGKALAEGATLAAIVQAFDTAGLPLAAAAQARIAALSERIGRLNLYERVSVLELGDDITLRELLATTTLRAYIIHEFSPRLVVVRDEAVDALVAELVKKGHTPLLV